MATRIAKKVLAYDLGGTKVAVGIVNDRGKVLDAQREPVVFAQGKKAVLQQLTSLGKNLLKKHPTVRRAGIASAGPLDPKKGLLLDPTNFSSAEGSWGITPLARLMSASLGIPVTLENDAAAAALAEHWVGAAKKYQNAMVLTLGTGLGTGIICNGELVRAGRNLHPEGGHLIIRDGDESAPCGCGNLGCAEAYISGKNFTHRARVRLGVGKEVTTQDIANRARQGDARAIAEFDEYAHMLAIAIHNYVVIYAPEIVVFTGSFAAAADLFIAKAVAELEHLLLRRRAGIDLLPKLTISKLDNWAGLVGAAHVALSPKTLHR